MLTKTKRQAKTKTKRQAKVKKICLYVIPSEDFRGCLDCQNSKITEYRHDGCMRDFQKNRKKTTIEHYVKTNLLDHFGYVSEVELTSENYAEVTCIEHGKIKMYLLNIEWLSI